MVRTQIQLPEGQVAVLKKIAASQNSSMAEIIRQSIDYYVKSKHSDKTIQQRRRAMTVAGNSDPVFIIFPRTMISIS